ncbi:MAG: hypothetical protein ND895_26310 [Pyrinomonadaceae bacterium]|nr:hypothetical protein [Pyrinomonadaceae bacterium]
MQFSKVKPLGRQVGLAIAVVLCSAVPICSQSLPSINGSWIWKEPARKNKPQVQFRLTLHRKGDVVSGVYSVDEFINGQWQGEDGNQTPFRGRVKGNSIQIEFDPSATVPGYQEHVVYSAPSDGRQPSTAVLTSSGSTLRWRLSSKTGIEGVPAQLALRRERRK